MPLPHYAPDDARITPAALDFLRTPEGLLLRESLAALPDPAAPTVAHIAALRKKFPAEPLHAGLVLFAQQPKARRKFPNIPFVWATPESLEQATARTVAQWKVARFARAQPQRIFDLCSGIGGDTLALADIAHVTAVDLSPVRAACLRFNASDRSPPPRCPIEIRTADITSLLDQIPPGSFIHIDPARRIATTRGKKRSPHYRDSIPSPELIEKIFSRISAGTGGGDKNGGGGGGAIKLSPATDFSELPPGHLELITHHRTVVQAILWRGALAENPAARTATLLSETHPPFTFTAIPELPALHPVPEFETLLQPPPQSPPSSPPTPSAGATAQSQITLYELDGALTRSNLAAPFARTLHLTPITPDAGYLLSRDLPLAHPALTPFRLLALIRFSESRVAQMLNALPASAPGPIEVKSRGAPPGINTDHLQKTWSHAAPSARTVLLFQYAGDTLAALTDRQKISHGYALPES